MKGKQIALIMASVLSVSSCLLFSGAVYAKEANVEKQASETLTESDDMDAVIDEAAESVPSAQATNQINYGNWIGFENEDGTLTLTGCRALSEFLGGTMVIPSEVEGKTVTAIGPYLSTHRFEVFDPSIIKAVVLPDSVISCKADDWGDELFEAYVRLKSLTLPNNSAFSAKADRLFSEKTSVRLEELKMYSPLSLENDWNNDALSSVERLSFYADRLDGERCYISDWASLTSLTLPSNMEHLSVYDMPKLESLRIPENIRTVEIEDCPALEHLEASSGVGSIRVGKCAELKTLDVSAGSKVGVSKCENLTSVTTADEWKDVHFDYFYDCPNADVKEIYISATSFSAGIFRNTKLETINLVLPDTGIFINKAAFYGAAQLKAIHVVNPRQDGAGLFSVDGVLYWRSAQKLDDGDYKYDLFAYPANKNPGGNYTLPENVCDVYVCAFWGCGLSSVTVPENARGYWNAFDCYNLYNGSINLPEELRFLEDKMTFDLCSCKLRIVNGSRPLNREYAADTGRACEILLDAIEADRIEFYTGNTYKITYNLNGGQAPAGNPSSYTAGTAPVTLKNPVREGYTFEGWIGDDGTAAKTTALTSGIFRDLTFTASWKKNGGKEETPNKDHTSVKVKSLKITGDSKQVAAGKKIRLTVTVTPANAAIKTVTWKSGNTKVATVDSTGLVTFKKNAGGKKVTITAAATDGSGVTASCTLTVKKGIVKKITISGKKNMKAGKSQKLKAKVTASSGANKKLKWVSSNTKYAKVTAAGKVTALKAGKGKTVKITAMATDGSGKKASIKIRIKK